MEICPKCGLPKQACVCEQIVKSAQKIKVTLEKKRFGKNMTIVSGLGSGLDIRGLAKELKNELACGGTFDVQAGTVELQGDHTKKIKEALVKKGFDAESIE